MNKVISILLGKKESDSSIIVTNDVIQSEITNFELVEKSSDKVEEDFFTLGMQYLASGNIDKAKKWFIIASSKRKPEAMKQLGEIYSVEGYEAFAKIWFEKARKLLRTIKE